MANLERRNKLTRALQCRYGASVDSFARTIWDVVMGLSERVMWRCCGCGVFWVREDGTIKKYEGKLLVLLAVSYEGAI